MHHTSEIIKHALSLPSELIAKSLADKLLAELGTLINIPNPNKEQSKMLSRLRKVTTNLRIKGFKEF